MWLFFPPDIMIFSAAIMTHPWTGGARRRALRCHFRNRYTCTGRRGSLYPMSRLSDRTLSSQLLGTDLEAEKIFMLPKCRWSYFSQAVKPAGKHLCWHVYQKSSQLLHLSESGQLWSLMLKQNKSNKALFNQTVWKCLQENASGETTSYRLRRISSGHGPDRSTCSSSCSPHRGACQTTGPLRSCVHLQYTDLMAKNTASKH